MDKNFKDLLTRFVAGDCTPAERAKIYEWYEKIADNELRLDEDEKGLIGSRMLANIQKQARRDIRRRRHIYPVAFLRLAAAIAVLSVFGVWFMGGTDFLLAKRRAQAPSVTTDIVYKNITDRTSLHALPDGTMVQLEPSSTLRFPKDFSDGDRRVYLTGAAFFEVVKDSTRPFYVYSGKIATRVLGTSFFVDAPADAVRVGVRVVTGKVSVFKIRESNGTETPTSEGPKDSPANGVILSPNQKVDYYIKEGHWVTGLVENPVPVKSIDVQNLSFVFSNTPIRKVLADINERFGIEVVTENERISQCTFTGDVSRMSLYDMLDVISNAIGASYEVKGTRILVTGKGCDSAGSEKVVE